jgi:hypothetical protein
MAFHNPKERSEEFLAEIRYKWRLNELGQLVVNNKYHKSGEVDSVFIGPDDGQGYNRVSIRGKKAREHHIVWYLNTGEWPKQPLDHIDGDKSNNHPDNLRLSTHRENTRAYKKVKGGASSKYRGVSKRPGTWVATIHVDDKSKHLGSFTCEKEAALAYNYAVLKYGYPPEALNQVFADDEVT